MRAGGAAVALLLFNGFGTASPEAQVTPVPLPNASGVPVSLLGITAGPDGALWFTGRGANVIGRISTAVAASPAYFPIPTPASTPVSITTGADGNHWFTEYDANRIGRVNVTTGQITEFVLPTPSSRPSDIAAGPDGALWFREVAPRVGRITTAGAITEFPIPPPSGEIT